MSEEITTREFLRLKKEEVERCLAESKVIDLDEEARFIGNEVRNLSDLISSVDHVSRHVANDNLPGWSEFLDKNNIQIEFSMSGVHGLLRAYGVIEILINEVKVRGVFSSVFEASEEILNNFKVELLKNSQTWVDAYNDLQDEYHEHLKTFLSERRLEKGYKEFGGNQVKDKFAEIEAEKEELIKELRDKCDSISKELEENKKSLEAIKDRTGFASLFEGFDNYLCRIKSKKKWVYVEKIVFSLVLFLTPVAGVILHLYAGLGYVETIPLIGLVVLFGVLLKVCLKKEDQLDQVMNKVEHKMAISAFYWSRVDGLKDEGEKQQAYTDYYNFIFSPIETTEWNAPDITDGLARIIKGLK